MCSTTWLTRWVGAAQDKSAAITQLYASYFGGRGDDRILAAAAADGRGLWIAGEMRSVIRGPRQQGRTADGHRSRMLSGAPRDAFVARIGAPAAGAAIPLPPISSLLLQLDNDDCPASLVPMPCHAHALSLPSVIRVTSSWLYHAMRHHSLLRHTHHVMYFVSTSRNPLSYHPMPFQKPRGGLTLPGKPCHAMLVHGASWAFAPTDVNSSVATGNRNAPLPAGPSHVRSLAVVLCPSGADGEVVHLTYIGGSGTDSACGISEPGEDGVWVVGSTTSPDLQATAATAAQAAHSGSNDIFVARIDSQGKIRPVPPTLKSQLGGHAASLYQPVDGVVSDYCRENYVGRSTESLTTCGLTVIELALTRDLLHVSSYVSLFYENLILRIVYH